ncbi:Mg2+ transporter protein, CorA-like/Zinc transport protein ZntB [Penicillium griseofulvum]|uniref:Mg2+ transporter protein, CorA-like/Zinc transport protein ZntB n=1 Tax=Penicillium patulum TaxID=5078 RepID=A0A135LFE9_PENPA|nr:Mg2+ transporter protein, CorA-like/Zinc transport protein ZntB [Penicillium griseofulvum]KXG47673.1 Mg2+ transporter protein, CorA-like/Zinc transport protein ZntB [Penicillium griseofulvum]
MSVHSLDYAQPGATRSEVDVEAGRPSVGSQVSPTGKEREGSSFPAFTSAARVNSTETTKRRARRNTARSYHPEGFAQDPNWQPGTEPGIDPTKPLPPYTSEWASNIPADLHRRCQITVVDFSEHDMQQYELDNDTLEQFLEREKEPWVQCRWINVNGLSWDVIQILGNHKRLHRLAIEDVVHTTNRTKADWYSDHAFVVLTLQKLMKIQEEDSSDSEDEEETPASRWKSRDRKSSVVSDKSSISLKRPTKWNVIMAALKDIFRIRSTGRQERKDKATYGSSVRPGLGQASNQNSHFGNVGTATETTARSLQRYRGGPNEDRIEFMERHAALSAKGLCVTLEQVSIFLHADNTVTSFFETSADDIEAPIVRRLTSPETILRQSCDASMLLQAILDAVIDLAIPVTMAYQDAIGDLELEVLTDPDIEQSKSLYILTSEIAVLRNSMQPMVAVINALRDHRSEPVGTPGFGVLRNTLSPSVTPAEPVDPRPHVGIVTPNLKSVGGTSVTISSMCHTYLGDALDHCITIVEGYDQMRRNADNMIDLIFNTIGAYQNESMKQLTLVTCLYLPMTFLTGYFGMNFTHFSSIENNEGYFWKIAVPFVCATIFFLMRDKLQRYAVMLAQRRLIVSSRKQRRQRKKK